MFWRFGFHNASSIDSLLDKDDVALEAILDEDDLLQECKAQNTRLIDYFQRVDVLQRLLGYVTGQIEGEDQGRFKYPYVATEVLCSEIWSIVETSIDSSDQILTPFWETVLDRPTEDMKTQMAMATHFAKINAVFLNKKPVEMLAFIQSQPNVVERLLRHVETPAFVDLLVRIMQLDEQPTGSGVLEWLSSERFVGRLIDMLSPLHSSDMQAVVSELIKGIISMASPSPGAGLTDNLQNGPASNRFARELAHRDNVSKMVDYILADYGPEPDEDIQDAEEMDEPSTPQIQTLPTSASSASSVVHSISIIVELIRKNNSDYFEPYLFHTLRNRLIQVQQHLQTRSDDGRETLEQAMKEMVDRMGVVHLGAVLQIICQRLDVFQQYLRKPRSTQGPVLTTVGSVAPLTFERYRICELYAELLHCSNMSILNRSPEFDHLYDAEGRLQGGLHSLEELARVIAIGSGENRDGDAMDEDNDEIEPALELPVSNASHNSPSLIDSDEDMSSDDDDPGSSDDDTMEEIAMYDESNSQNRPTSPLPQPPMIVPSSPNAASLPSPSEIAAQGAAQRSRSFQSSDSDSLRTKTSSHSRRSSRRRNTVENSRESIISIGETLKRRFLDVNVLGTLLDLFFEFPWNNFLHSVVYDLVHQILTGRVDGSLNRELTIALFRDAQLMHRIVDGQKRNDLENSKPKGVRLGYMGHLTLISEDVISALEHYPPELRLSIAQFAPQPAWDEYVTGRYNETKKKDTSLLGGGKPVVAAGPARAGARWKVDEEDTASAGSSARGGNLSGELKRAGGGRPVRESSADFGPAPMEDEEEGEEDGVSSSGPPQFARYLAQEMQSSEQFGSPSSDASDDEEEDGGWLTHSNFALSNPPVSARNHSSDRRPLDASFDDSFAPSDGTKGPFHVGGEDDVDAFGPFSDSAVASGTDPFTFSSSFTEDDATFESFGDFGDFQSADDGELTPTAGSWTLASGSSASDGWSSEGSGHIEDTNERDEKDKRTAATDSPGD